MPQPSLTQKILWPSIPALIVVLVIGWGMLYHHYINPAPIFPHAAVIIKHADGSKSYTYNMEIATTEPEQRYGLMFRRSLAPNAGMLFLWDKDQVISMWMKNTYIPLDMLFIRRNGVIEKITAYALPFDLTPLSSEEPIRGVIEIGGGEAGRLGIRIGDRVVYPAFSGAP